MPEKTNVPMRPVEKAARRWDPVEQLQELQDEMARFWGQTCPFTMRSFTWPMLHVPATPTTWTPRMDLYEKNGNLVIKADLPGARAEDVEVTLEDGDLIIKGERKAEKEVDEKDYYRMERSYGSYYRRQPLPEGIKPEQITAPFADGVLELTIPKPVAKKPEAQKINVATK